ncbi:MAG: phosphotransferase family protein [Phycisphaerales bacterium]
MPGPHGPSGLPAGPALGQTLAPQLIEASGRRLGPIRWFRSDWQRGGGATGYASFDTGAAAVEVVVKLPVGYTEWKWTTRMGDPTRCPPGCECPTPKVFASGVELGGYDLGWLVLERLPGMPLAGKLDGDGAERLIEAATAFHERAGQIEPVSEPPAPPDWEKLVRRGREALLTHGIPDEQRWRHALRDLTHELPRLVSAWRGRTINTWCHGDLHPGNAMRRNRPSAAGSGAGPCVLIDLALVHAGHWIEDALYFERIYWGHETLLRGACPVDLLAAARRLRGLPVEPGYQTLANVRRVLMAGCALAMIEREGNARYIRAALDKLEQLLAPTVGAL